MRKFWVGFGVLMMLLGSAVPIAHAATEARRLRVAGTLELDDHVYTGKTCTGSGHLAPAHRGAVLEVGVPATLKPVLAQARLSAGTVRDGQCDFAFTVQVPQVVSYAFRLAGFMWVKRPAEISGGTTVLRLGVTATGLPRAH